jgi:excisionase family DNA binding protein
MYLLEVSVHSDELLSPRDAARSLGVSYPTLKQWIYKKKLHSIRTAGGHHRIPASEIERFLPRTEEKDVLSGRRNFRRISGRNQLVAGSWRYYSGLLAQVKLSIGGRASPRLSQRMPPAKCASKGPDRGSPHQSHGSHDRAHEAGPCKG